MDAPEPVVQPSTPLRLGRADQAVKPPRALPTAALLGLAAVVLFSTFAMVLALSFWHELVDLKETLTGRCETRVEYDKRFIRAAEGDARFYADLLDVAQRAEKIRVEPLTPEMRALVEEQKQIVLTAQQRKQAIIDQGVIGNCDQYRAVAK